MSTFGLTQVVDNYTQLSIYHSLVLLSNLSFLSSCQTIYMYPFSMWHTVL